MTTINTIEDLARILQEQPTWAEALRALILTREIYADLIISTRDNRHAVMEVSLTAARTISDGRSPGTAPRL